MRWRNCATSSSVSSGAWSSSSDHLDQRALRGPQRGRGERGEGRRASGFDPEQRRIDRDIAELKRDVTELKPEVAELKADVRLMKRMLGFNLALTSAVLLKLILA